MTHTLCKKYVTAVAVVMIYYKVQQNSASEKNYQKYCDHSVDNSVV